jgi:hypothetical protein
VGGRKIVLLLSSLALLGLGVAQALADDSPPPVVCVSAVGPVDASGHGDATPTVAGDCP